METVWKVLENIPLVTILGALIASIIGMFKWLDQRKREQEDKRFQAFHKMVLLASGVDEQGKTVKITQVVAAVYQLQKYRQYAFAAIPILEFMKAEYGSMSDLGSRRDLVLNAIEETINKLS